MQLSRTSWVALRSGFLAGTAHALLIYALLGFFEYQSVIPNATTPAVLLGSFALGFVPVACSVYTRLLTPGIGFGLLACAVTVVEVTTPGPERIGEMGDAIVVDGAFHVLWYAESWAVWLSLLLVAAIAEYATRSGYGLGDDSVRNLPDRPLSRSTGAILVGVASLLVGTATLVQLGQNPNWGPAGSFLGGGFATLATAVALGGLLGRGLLAPIALYAWVVPTAMHTEVFTVPENGIHILGIGFLAAISVGIAVLEASLRTSVRGWASGKFGKRPGRTVGH